jgi:hypothetical protein
MLTTILTWVLLIVGLGSILFAINIDRPEWNAIKPPTGLDSLFSRPSAKPVAIQTADDDICPIASPHSASNIGTVLSDYLRVLHGC